MNFKSDSWCVDDLGRAQSHRVNSSVPAATRATAMEAGTTLFLLLMTYLWSTSGFLIVFPLLSTFLRGKPHTQGSFTVDQ